MEKIKMVYCENGKTEPKTKIISGVSMQDQLKKINETMSIKRISTPEDGGLVVRVMSGTVILTYI